MKIRLNIIAFIGLLIGFSACDKMGLNGGGSSDVALNNDKDSLSYSAGMTFAQSFVQQTGEEDFNIDLVVAGINDVLKKNDCLVSDENAQMVIQKYFMAKQQEQMAKANEASGVNLEEGQKFLEENSKKEGVITLESGLQYEVIKEGSGASPKLEDTITAHYHGTLLDGTVFDSSVDRGEPATFPLNRVIGGWTEGVQLMSVGSKYRFY
ncbi:MAG: FKBP-type peptidyl-prolyl cis-trans isomerase, partial [Flammeovirgaceae bacterium]|nr:FKBP-type peptidyl-prolyl cis-trans isomerase [Flammeovirgaceae bacterium]